ncbi:MAG: glycosyltransferase family 2 protein [Thermoanaerobacteraceae bacterium]|nr:glycosyltransferase family 2 protein [Thermoanaerobacteraceae bacterium]
MLAFVIPARNEAKSIYKVLTNLHYLVPEMLIPVINGCSDDTLLEVRKLCAKNMHILYFEEALGIDVPRALGAFYAFRHGADRVIFVDGDMTGEFQHNLTQIDQCLVQGADMALTNCYPYITFRQPLTSSVLEFRAKLNCKLNVFTELGLANPAHGPHGISRQLYAKVPTRELAVPPVSLALAVQNGLNVRVATAIPHVKLGSLVKGPIHSKKVAATIIGDCIEAINLISNKPRLRIWRGTEYHGYSRERRFDLLEEYLLKPDSWQVFRCS